LRYHGDFSNWDANHSGALEGEEYNLVLRWVFDVVKFDCDWDNNGSFTGEEADCATEYTSP
jgi:hypothetical protein